MTKHTAGGSQRHRTMLLRRATGHHDSGESWYAWIKELTEMKGASQRVGNLDRVEDYHKEVRDARSNRGA